MILLRKFLTFHGVAQNNTITYGAYEFEIITFGIWFEFTYKNIFKPFINYKERRHRHLATFYVGKYKIYLNQSYITLLGIISLTVCLRNDINWYRDGSPKKFIHLYTRILAENCDAHATKN